MPIIIIGWGKNVWERVHVDILNFKFLQGFASLAQRLVCTVYRKIYAYNVFNLWFCLSINVIQHVVMDILFKILIRHLFKILIRQERHAFNAL